MPKGVWAKRREPRAQSPIAAQCYEPKRREPRAQSPIAAQCSEAKRREPRAQSPIAECARRLRSHRVGVAGEGLGLGAGNDWGLGVIGCLGWGEGLGLGVVGEGLVL